MSGITNPAEEYFKDGLWGWVATAWKKLVATAGGALHIQFAGQEADVEVKQTTPADLTPGICGWDGAAWRKLPLMWGYSETYYEAESQVTTGVGDYTLTASTVPNGEVWVITNVLAFNQATVNSFIALKVYDGANTFEFRRKAGPAVDEEVIFNGSLALSSGARVRGVFYGCGATETITMHLFGYKMKIAE